MNSDNRIQIVDILRGFALLLIILIHYVEHFEFFHPPDYHFLFSAQTDRKVMDTVFLLISGKAYSVFALLFGFSFFLQLDRKAQQGIDFRATFLWRMCLLLVMGFIHSLVYRGDILHVYALLAFPLVLIYRMNTRILWALLALLVLQIPTIVNLLQSFSQPDFTYVQHIPTYWEEGTEVYKSGNLWDVIQYNFWKGRVSVYAWTVYNGRYLQLFALYIAGLLIGRARVFERIRAQKRSWSITAIVSFVIAFTLKFLQHYLSRINYTDIQQYFINTLLNSWANLAITALLVALFVRLYVRFESARIFELLAAYGKMSLSNYVFQAVSGVILFYGFGFGLYKYLGSTWSVIMGIMVFTLQAYISEWWNRRFYYGPLEWAWRASTFFDPRLRFRRKQG